MASVRSRDVSSNDDSWSPTNVAHRNSLHNSESISAVDITALPSTDQSSPFNIDHEKTESQRLIDAPSSSSLSANESISPSTGITTTGMYVLILLAVQNCSKNLLLRFVMKSRPEFLTSAAVIGVELVKLVLSLAHIRLVDRQPLSSAVVFLKQDKRNTILMGVPAACYSLQMTLEYIALANLDAAIFSVLVQTKLLATAGCAVLVLRKKIKKVQLISLMLLTIGVMLCNMKDFGKSSNNARRLIEGGRDLQQLEDVTPETTKGIVATLAIAACSGFASVYTEKVIKAKRTSRKVELPTQQEQKHQSGAEYGLAFTQVQLAVVSLVIMGLYCIVMELDVILEKGLWYGFDVPASISIFVSAFGGLTVAAVLKFADAVLKGYATAVSVILTGVLSMILFNTQLNVLYFLGIGNVICAVLLYSATDLDRMLC